MITFWLPQLEAYPFYVIYFVDVQRYEQTAKLEIFPAPDVVIRVFMAFRQVMAACLISLHIGIRLEKYTYNSLVLNSGYTVHECKCTLITESCRAADNQA